MNALNEATLKSLKFITSEQFEENTGYYDPGQWPVTMKSYLFPALVGLGRLWGRPSQEPTAFATSAIITLIAEAYVLNPNLRSVPTTIQNGIESLAAFREGNVFFYYPLIDFEGLKIHAPKDPHYVPRRMMSFALVPPDADTTAVSFTALAYSDLIQKQKPMSEYKVPAETLGAFNKFRDLDRKGHPYNRMNGVKKTGAYLTWLWDEKAKHSSFFSSMNAKPKEGYRIVFGRNDVDCVVNANVLRLLTLTNNQDHQGYASSCQLLNTAIQKTQTHSCGVYYPNTFNPLFSISSAYKAGASCLNDSRDQAIKFILGRQNEDGSWANDPGMGREDRVQSTAYALNALLNYVDVSDRRLTDNVQKAVRFLLSKAKQQGKSEDQIYWKGEVFFSGSAVARNTLLWRSDAFTTALVMLSLVKAEIYLKNEVSK